MCPNVSIKEHLRNMIAPNVPDPPKKLVTFLDGSGFHYCTRCKACKTTRQAGARKKLTQFKSNVTGETFKIRPLITCGSDHVTYVLECPCSLQYVGRTTRQLKTRIKEHLANIKKSFPNHSVSRHFASHHGSDPGLCTFYAIDKITRNWRGTHMTRSVSQNEMKWVHRLQTMQPSGLNIELDLNCFLANDWPCNCLFLPHLVLHTINSPFVTPLMNGWIDFRLFGVDVLFYILHLGFYTIYQITRWGCFELVPNWKMG